MHESDLDGIARQVGGAVIPATRLERAIDRLIEVLVAVAGTRSWGK